MREAPNLNATLIEFRQFLLRGNIVELAIAFVLGTAFAAVVTSFVTYIINPLISMLFGEPNLAFLDFTINDAVFNYGLVLNAIIAFIAIAAAIFFVVVKPLTLLRERMARGEEPAPEPTEEVALLREIRDLLARG